MPTIVAQFPQSLLAELALPLDKKLFYVIRTESGFLKSVGKFQPGSPCVCSIYQMPTLGGKPPTCPHVEALESAHRQASCFLIRFDNGEELCARSLPTLSATGIHGMLQSVASVGPRDPIPAALRSLPWLGSVATLDINVEATGRFLSEVIQCSLALFNNNREVKAPLASAYETRTNALANSGLQMLREAISASPEGAKQAALLGLNSPEFWVAPEVDRQLGFAGAHNDAVLLTGPAGCGKTELLVRMAKALGRPCQVFNMGGMTEARSSLVGCMSLTKEGTQFVESRFLKALTVPNMIIVLDELSRSNDDASNILLPLLDRQRKVSVDEDGGRIVEVAEGIMFCGTANLGIEYTGAASALDRALSDRMSAIQLSYPPVDAETKIVSGRTKLAIGTSSRLVGIANKQREAATQRDEYGSCISTRQLIRCGLQMAYGIPPEEAFRYTICTAFSKEGGESSEVSRLMQLFSATLGAKARA